jgi:hypothetical protein
VETINASRTPGTLVSFRQLLARKDYFFADIDGRGAVIDSYDDEWHAAMSRPVRIVREGAGNDKRRAQSSLT